jgi:hypothetical protein
MGTLQLLLNDSISLSVTKSKILTRPYRFICLPIVPTPLCPPGPRLIVVGHGFPFMLTPCEYPTGHNFTSYAAPINTNTEYYHKRQLNVCCVGPFHSKRPWFDTTERNLEKSSKIELVTSKRGKRVWYTRPLVEIVCTRLTNILIDNPMAFQGNGNYVIMRNSAITQWVHFEEKMKCQCTLMYRNGSHTTIQTQQLGSKDNKMYS